MYNLIDIRKKVERPIIFLCGPYFDQNDSGDRRGILRRFFHDEFDGKYLPLIIDNFLNPENIRDETIDIQLLEEIFASISFKTYIFLDTMSTSAELGLFANNALKNNIQVFLPKISDIIDESNVGYFVKEIVLKVNSERINYEYYNPKIIRRPIATDYVIEHYGFIKNKVPKRIRNNILNDTDLDLINNHIYIKEKSSLPKKYNLINFQLSDDYKKMTIYMSIKRLFYIVANLIYSEYREELNNKVKEDFSDTEIRLLIQKLKKSLFLSIYIDKRILRSIDNNLKINIITRLNSELFKLIKHIAKFITVYHKHGRFYNYSIIKSTQSFIIKEKVDFSRNPINLFELSNKDLKLIEKINKNKNGFYEKFTINNKGKVRKLVKYRRDNAEKTRSLHSKIVSKLLKFYDFNRRSFAYKEAVSIKDCVIKHKQSSCFIKYDIKKFFNSIDKEILIKQFLDIFSINEIFRGQLERIIDSLFFDNNLPLGLITSPLLSDIYLSQFDREINKKISDERIIYTRYADDILFSKDEMFTSNVKNKLNKIVKHELNNIKLEINQKKSTEVSLDEKGQHFKYLGVNIVKMDNNNKLTVGKKYKNDIAKQFLHYISIDKELDNEKKFYLGKKIAGKVGFVKEIEGLEGFSYIKERILRSTEGRVRITGDKLPIK